MHRLIKIGKIAPKASKDIKKSIFVFNKIDGEQSVCIRDINVDAEWK